MTFYTSRRAKLVGFLRAPPLNPPTVTQELLRDYFRTAASQWRTAPASTRQAWLAAARGARLRINGFNLWTWYIRTRDDQVIETIETQSGINLPRPS